MEKLKWVNLALRGIMEAGIILGFGFWGFQKGEGTISKIILGICVPLVGFGFWGLVDFHRSGRAAEPLRLIQELIISGLVAILLYTSGEHFLGLLLGFISIAHHILVYFLGSSLQKH